MEVRTLAQFIDAILLRKVAFLVAFFVIFTISYAVLAKLDWLPELVTAETAIEAEEEILNTEGNERTAWD